VALLEFTDSKGKRWTAWEVRPPTVYSPVRSPVDRRVNQQGDPSAERRATSDRRTRPFHPALAYGWICFQSEAEKRRLAPPPEDWESCSEEELERLLKQGSPVGR
jgi:hypothetical protein